MYPKLRVTSFYGKAPEDIHHLIETDHIIQDVELDGPWVGKMFEELIQNATFNDETSQTFKILQSAFKDPSWSKRPLRVDLTMIEQLTLYSALANVQQQVLATARINAEKTLHRLQNTQNVTDPKNFVRTTMHGTSVYILTTIMRLMLVLQDALVNGFALVFSGAPKGSPELKSSPV